MIPRWIKILYSLFLCVLVPIYWRDYGPTNFLWGSDIALFVILGALWLENPLLNSMMVIGVLPFEITWIMDFVSGGELLGIAGYMFEPERKLYLKALSLFHVMLPVLMIFLLYRIGYDRRALLAQTLLLWIVLPVTYLATDSVENINLVYGFGKEPQTLMHPLLHLVLEMALLPVAIYLPAHMVLQRIFNRG